MPHKVTVTLGDQEWHMPASYAASKEFAELVGDPIQLALQVERNELRFTTDMVVTAIYIGVTHAGARLTKDQVGDLIFETEGGVANYIEVLGEYIGALVAGGPQKTIATGGSKKKRPAGSK